jgi:hypothetical protein
MDANQQDTIRTALDTPIAQQTPRQIIDLLLFMDTATDEDMTAVGLDPEKVKDL